MFISRIRKTLRFTTSGKNLFLPRMTLFTALDSLSLIFRKDYLRVLFYVSFRRFAYSNDYHYAIVETLLA